MNVSRREFLFSALTGVTTILGGTLLATLISGCGGQANSPSLVDNKIKVVLAMDGLSAREIEVSPGASVLDAICAAYSYERIGNLTKINGQIGSYKYFINGVEPSGVGSYAGDYKISSNSTINLQMI